MKLKPQMKNIIKIYEEIFKYKNRILFKFFKIYFLIYKKKKICKFQC